MMYRSQNKTLPEVAEAAKEEVKQDAKDIKEEAKEIVKA